MSELVITGLQPEDTVTVQNQSDHHQRLKIKERRRLDNGERFANTYLVDKGTRVRVQVTLGQSIDVWGTTFTVPSDVAEGHTVVVEARVGVVGHDRPPVLGPDLRQPKRVIDLGV